jgi:hypothetical protein
VIADSQKFEEDILSIPNQASARNLQSQSERNSMSAIEKLGVDDVKIKELTSNNGTSNRVGDDQIDTTKRSRQNRKMAKAPKGV